MPFYVSLILVYSWQSVLIVTHNFCFQVFRILYVTMFRQLLDYTFKFQPEIQLEENKIDFNTVQSLHKNIIFIRTIMFNLLMKWILPGSNLSQLLFHYSFKIFSSYPTQWESPVFKGFARFLAVLGFNRMFSLADIISSNGSCHRSVSWFLLFLQHFKV